MCTFCLIGYWCLLEVMKIRECLILPRMERFSAHTSTVAFIQEIIRQWYWKMYLSRSKPKDFEQSCCMESQFILLAAICQDAPSLGQVFNRYLTVNAKTCTLIRIQQMVINEIELIVYLLLFFYLLKGLSIWYTCKQIYLVLAVI